MIKSYCAVAEAARVEVRREQRRCLTCAAYIAIHSVGHDRNKVFCGEKALEFLPKRVIFAPATVASKLCHSHVKNRNSNNITGRAKSSQSRTTDSAPSGPFHKFVAIKQARVIFKAK